MKKIILVLIGFALVSLQSCSVGTSLEEGISGMGLTHFFETEEQCKASYPQYVKDMQVFNQAAVEQHQTLEPVMTIEKYCHLEKKEAVATKNTVDQK